jgi:uncharacterized protein YhfF
MSIEITDKIKIFWDGFISSDEKFSYLKENKIDAWHFGNTKEMANSLGALVIQGKKRATCSLLRAYRGEEELIPQVGRYSVLIDGDHNPLCIIFLNETFITKFCDMTAEFAYLEGEGDRSLEHWREVHNEFFGEYDGFTKEDLLICERFSVAYQA